MVFVVEKRTSQYDEFKNVALYNMGSIGGGILNDGKILCDRIYIHGERSCVWLSTNPNWEETVRKSIQNTKTGVQSPPLSRDRLFAEGYTPVRIEINPTTLKLTNWKTHRKKIPKRIAQALEAAAKEWGANPDEWRASYSPISLESFIFPIESWNGEQWVEALKADPLK